MLQIEEELKESGPQLEAISNSGEFVDQARQVFFDVIHCPCVLSHRKTSVIDAPFSFLHHSYLSLSQVISLFTLKF